jgi:hypothetical protein
MTYTAIRCKNCRRSFGSHLDHCPICGTISPRGLRNTVLKVISLIVFLASLVSIVGTCLHFWGR